MIYGDVTDIQWGYDEDYPQMMVVWEQLSTRLSEKMDGISRKYSPENQR